MKHRVANADGEASFDRAMLAGIGLRTLTTTTPWADGRQKYLGVLARDLPRAVGARGRRVTARGLDGRTSPRYSSKWVWRLRELDIK